MRKGNGNKTAVGLCLCAAAVTMGCSEGTDFGRLAGGESGIGFEVSLAGEGEGVATRSTLGTKSFEGGASEGKTFRLRTGVTENRENPFASIAKSRATEITNENLFDSFGVYAYAYDSSKSWEEICPSNGSTGSGSYSLYIADDIVTQSGSYWGFTPARYWPSAYKLTFFAYAPTALDESGSGSLAVSLDGSDKLPQISYTVPSGYANQKDLVVATATDQTESAAGGSVPLTFEHILTAVQVKCGSFSEGTVSNITLSGIKGTGTYNMATGSWSLDETTTSYAVTGEFAAKDSASLLTEGYTLMLLPQKLGAEATITLTYTPTDGTENDEMTLTAGLRQEDLESGKQEWEMGEKVTYTISYSAGNLEINGHEAVDLGLSVKWATCNVGADVPADYGDYYGFGEINVGPNGIYSSTTTGSWYGVEVTEDTIKGNPLYDAATANWESPWRLPTKTEIDELIEKCTCVAAKEYNSAEEAITGIWVTGPNGRSIFLPYTGFYANQRTHQGTSNGYFWSCTPDNDITGNEHHNAYELMCSSSGISIHYNDRYSGYTVRPVVE